MPGGMNRVGPHDNLVPPHNHLAGAIEDQVGILGVLVVVERALGPGPKHVEVHGELASTHTLMHQQQGPSAPRDLHPRGIVDVRTRRSGRHRSVRRAAAVLGHLCDLRARATRRTRPNAGRSGTLPQSRSGAGWLGSRDPGDILRDSHQTVLRDSEIPEARGNAEVAGHLLCRFHCSPGRFFVGEPRGRHSESLGYGALPSGDRGEVEAHHRRAHYRRGS